MKFKLSLRYWMWSFLSILPYESIYLRYLKADLSLQKADLKEYDESVEELRLETERLRIAAWATRLKGMESFNRIQPMITFMQKQVNVVAPSKRQVRLAFIADVERRIKFIETMNTARETYERSR